MSAKKWYGWGLCCGEWWSSARILAVGMAVVGLVLLRCVLVCFHLVDRQKTARAGAVFVQGQVRTWRLTQVGGAHEAIASGKVSWCCFNSGVQGLVAEYGF